MLNFIRSTSLRDTGHWTFSVRQLSNAPSKRSSPLKPESIRSRTCRRLLRSSAYSKFQDGPSREESGPPPLPGRTARARPEMPSEHNGSTFGQSHNAGSRRSDRTLEEEDDFFKDKPERTPYRPKRGERSVQKAYDRASREMDRESDLADEEDWKSRSKYRNDRPADPQKKAVLEKKRRQVEEAIPSKPRVSSDLNPIEPPNFTLSINSVRPVDAPPLAARTNKLERRMTRLKPVTETIRREEQAEEVLERAAKLASEAQLDNVTHCWGCGVEFQTTEPHKIGFVAEKAIERYKLKKQLYELNSSNSTPISSPNVISYTSSTPSTTKFVPTPEMLELERKIMGLDADEGLSDSQSAIRDMNKPPERVLCERCWNLRYNSKAVSVALEAEYFKEAISPIKALKTRPLILKLVDLFDFHGSFIPSFRKYVGNNRVLIVATKYDLLPKGAHVERVRAWIHTECKKFGIEPVGVSVISHSGFGVRELADKLEYYREGGDVYVMGSANVGKSTFINLLIDIFKGPKDKKVTVSPVPGTTLNFLSLAIGTSSFLYDTPGIITSKQIYNYLSHEELKKTMPKKQIRPSVYRLAPGTTLFIGGLARFDYVEGPPLAYFTVFATNELYIHKTSTIKANELYETQLGTLLTPPFAAETLTSWPGLGAVGTEHVIENDDGNWQKACTDIVFSGLGWVSVTMKGTAKVQTWYPEGCSVGRRPPLMPFESHLGVLPNPRFNMKPSSTASRPRYDPL